MAEFDTGEQTTEEPQSKAGSGAHASRRNFMRKVFFASGATAVATMGGAGAWAAMADDTATAEAAADASASPSDAPSGGPGGGAGGPGNQTITEDFFGLTTDGKRIDDLFTIHSTKSPRLPSSRRRTPSWRLSPTTRRRPRSSRSTPPSGGCGATSTPTSARGSRSLT